MFCKKLNDSFNFIDPKIIRSKVKVIFIICRILTSVYEAVTYSWQEKCEQKGLDYQPLWFTYSVVIINLLLVS